MIEANLLIYKLLLTPCVTKAEPSDVSGQRTFSLIIPFNAYHYIDNLHIL